MSGQPSYRERRAGPLRLIPMTLRLAAALVAAGLAVSACASKTDTAQPGAPGGDTSTSTQLPSPTATPTFGGDEGAQLVVPKPGTTKPRAIPWQRAKPGKDGRSVRIFFTSGVEPCHVLDHVKVNYLAERVMVTLYEGSDRRSMQQVCIELAAFKAVDVRLDEPIGQRSFGDGAPR